MYIYKGNKMFVFKDKRKYSHIFVHEKIILKVILKYDRVFTYSYKHV